MISKSTLNKVSLRAEHENHAAAVKTQGFPTQPTRQRSLFQSALDVTEDGVLIALRNDLVDEEQDHKSVIPGSTSQST